MVGFVDVPEGELNGWRIRRFTVTDDDAALHNLRVPASRGISPGTYTQLSRSGIPIMSDTPAEVADHRTFIRTARTMGGRVLIHGLGLGLCVQGVLGDIPGQPPSLVTHVLVIEQSPDVMALVAPHYRARFGERFEVRQGNAYTWKPQRGEVWSCVWHDVWTDLCLDNLADMTRLHRRFARRCAWQDSWGRQLLKRYQRQEREIWS